MERYRTKFTPEVRLDEADLLERRLLASVTVAESAIPEVASALGLDSQNPRVRSAISLLESNLNVVRTHSHMLADLPATEVLRRLDDVRRAAKSLLRALRKLPWQAADAVDLNMPRSRLGLPTDERIQERWPWVDDIFGLQDAVTSTIAEIETERGRPSDASRSTARQPTVLRATELRLALNGRPRDAVDTYIARASVAVFEEFAVGPRGRMNRRAQFVRIALTAYDPKRERSEARAMARRALTWVRSRRRDMRKMSGEEPGVSAQTHSP